MNDAHDDISFIVAFPLPFRVLFLIGLGIAGWAANLHGLRHLGVDAATALDLNVDPDDSVAHVDHRHRGFKLVSDPASLYTPLYHFASFYIAWCFAAWVLYHLAVHGNPSFSDLYKFIPSLCALLALIALLNPYDVLAKRERDAFLLSIRRCLFASANSPVYFSDVVFADIFTSYAKVLGDVWLSLFMLLPGGSLLTPPRQDGWARWILPTLMSLPYAVRFRQCMIEYCLPYNESRRPLYNAVKYASSFPVIYLSAAQRLVVKDLVAVKGEQVVQEAWHGEHQLFRLWLLAAIVNSLYSFWWDVTNDWGFDLLKPSSHTSKRHSSPPRPLLLPSMHERAQSITNPLVRENSSTPLFSLSSTSRRSSHPYGLRSILLFPLPLYPLAIFLDLILRLTWSVKLSSHLHAHMKSEGSILIFWIEVAELVRRWVWVFVRVEWEVIKSAQEGYSATRSGVGHSLRSSGRSSLEENEEGLAERLELMSDAR
ncbi:EXS family-domain-containing protein [Amylostereum chailletii]|nr:EXS family-domain-containing protein [Amylostereum chailletii]